MAYIIAIILFLIIVVITIKFTKVENLLQGSYWLYIAYGFLLITHFFTGIEYRYGDIYRILPYFCLCLLMIIVGERIGMTVQTRSLSLNLNIKLRSAGLVAILGSLLFVFDILRLNQVNFGTRIEDFGVSIIGTIGNAFSGFGILVWLTALYNYRIKKIRIPIIAYLSAASFVAGGIVSAGRQAVILLIVMSLIMLIWTSCYNRLRKRIFAEKTPKAPTPWGFYLLIALFFSYFIFVSNVRSGISDIDNKILSFEKGFNATTSVETKTLVHQLGPFSDIFIEFAYYYSHELVRLDLLYQYYEYPPLLGMSQMVFLERRLQWLFGKQSEASWQQVELALEAKGRISSHTWSTFVSDYILDYGRIGAPIACLATGLLVGVLFRKYRLRPTKQLVIRQVLICGGIVFSIQFSPLSELIYFIPLMFCSFINLKDTNRT